MPEITMYGTPTCKDCVIAKKVFDELGSRYLDRSGGYTRITKIGSRKGDGAEVSVLEFV